MSWRVPQGGGAPEIFARELTDAQGLIDQALATYSRDAARWAALGIAAATVAWANLVSET